MTNTTKKQTLTTQSRISSRDHHDCLPSVVVRFPVPNTDVGLVSALRTKHPYALRTLCERYSGELLRVATRLLGPDPDVASVVLTTLCQALNRLDELTDSRAFRYWLLSQLVVQSRRRLQTRRFRHWFNLKHAGRVFCGESCSEQLVSTYDQLDHLGIETRIVFCLVVIHSMAPTEASLVLGTSALEVKAKLDKAHERFARRVQSHAPHLAQRHLSHTSLGIDIANEQERMLAHDQIFEFDLQEKANATRRLTGFRIKRLAPVVALASSLGLLTAATVVFIAYFQPITFQVTGEDVEQPHNEAQLGVWIVAPEQQAKTVSFSDGATTSLAPGTRVRVLHTNYRGSTSVLETGMMNLSSSALERTEHNVATGPFVTRIVNGQANVHWDFRTETLTINVHHGSVVLAGCQFGEGNSITGGRSIEARCLIE